MTEVNELKRLNKYESETIINALKMLAQNGSDSLQWSAKAMLEDEAEFVRGLFWSKK